MGNRKQTIDGEWKHSYEFRTEPNVKVEGSIVVSIEETKHIKSEIAGFFEETLKTIGRKFADRFQETKPIMATLFIKFTETCPTMAYTIKKFEETKPIKALVFMWFVNRKKIYGETKSIEEDILREIERIMESE